MFDSTAPVATVNAAPITTGGSSNYSFTVTYSDNIQFDVATINRNNVTVMTPSGGRITPHTVTFTSNPGDTQVVATYTVTAPGGDWGPEDDGAYSIMLHTGTARDTAVNEVAEFVTPFNVMITGDITAPTAPAQGRSMRIWCTPQLRPSSSGTCRRRCSLGHDT